MLRTFHIAGSNKNETQQGAEQTQLNLSECNNGKKVILGVDTGDQYTEIALNQQQFHELCDLRYEVALSEEKIEEQGLVGSNQLVLQIA